jgi:aminoglycoside phosphotransferase family enzyme
VSAKQGWRGVASKDLRDGLFVLPFWHSWQARRRTHVSGREEAVERANEAQQEMLKAGASKH